MYMFSLNIKSARPNVVINSRKSNPKLSSFLHYIYTLLYIFMTEDY